MRQLNHPYWNCKPFLNQLNHYWEIVTQTWPEINIFMPFAVNWNKLVTLFPVNACRLLESYRLVNFAVASWGSSEFWDKKLCQWWRQRSPMAFCKTLTLAFRLKMKLSLANLELVVFNVSNPQQWEGDRIFHDVLAVCNLYRVGFFLHLEVNHEVNHEIVERYWPITCLTLTRSRKKTVLRDTTVESESHLLTWVISSFQSSRSFWRASNVSASTLTLTLSPACKSSGACA